MNAWTATMIAGSAGLLLLLPVIGLPDVPTALAADPAAKDEPVQRAVSPAPQEGERPWFLGSAQPFGLLVMPEMVKLPPPDKKLFLKITAGYQYDSNVILNAVGVPVPPAIGEKGDSRLVLNLVGNYIPLRTAKGEVMFNYSFFHSDHAELDDFNLTQNMAELTAKYAVTDRLALRYSAVYQHLLLGTELFDHAVMTGPSLNITSGKRHTTVLDLRYRDTQYSNVAIFTRNADRTGANYSAALTHGVALSPATLVRAGYAYDVDNTRTPLWDGEGHRINVEGNFRVLHDTLFNIYGEYYRKDYDGVYASIGARREDRAWSGVVTLTTYFSERYGVSLRSLSSRNRSNVPAFDVSRLIYGVLFDARF